MKISVICINIIISVGLLCVSRFKHGKYSDLIGLHENEFMLSKLE